MKYIFPPLFLSLLCYGSLPAFAKPLSLLQSGTSWDGGKIVYPGGEPEISSIILHLKEGQEAKYHCHPVPTFGYVLSGKVVVETIDNKQVTIHQGQSVVEVMDTVHRGKAIDGDAKIVVFYAGAKGVPTTLFPDIKNGTTDCR